MFTLPIFLTLSTLLQPKKCPTREKNQIAKNERSSIQSSNKKYIEHNWGKKLWRFPIHEDYPYSYHPCDFRHFSHKMSHEITIQLSRGSPLDKTKHRSRDCSHRRARICLICDLRRWPNEQAVGSRNLWWIEMWPIKTNLWIFHGFIPWYVQKKSHCESHCEWKSWICCNKCDGSWMIYG